MVTASGIIEVNGVNNVEKIAGELKRRGMSIDEIESGKILFLMERETVDDVKAEINSLRGTDYIKNVHLAYYSLENNMQKS